MSHNIHCMYLCAQYVCKYIYLYTYIHIYRYIYIFHTYMYSNNLKQQHIWKETFPMSQAHGSRCLVAECLTCSHSQNVAVSTSDFGTEVWLSKFIKMHKNPPDIIYKCIHTHVWVCIYIYIYIHTYEYIINIYIYTDTYHYIEWYTVMNHTCI